jgi:hypothetical protein
MLAAATLAALALAFQCWGRHLYNYRVRERGIEIVVLGRIVAWRLRFDDITSIRKVSFVETWRFRDPAVVFSLRLGNRLWGDGALVQRRRGCLRAVLMSPDDVEAFVADGNRGLRGGGDQ